MIVDEYTVAFQPPFFKGYKMFYLKLYYKLLNWEWYTNPNVFRLFIHCLLKANRVDKNWQGFFIKRGSFITSYAHLAQELHLSIQQIRTAISKLELTGEITRKQQGSNTLITIKNYNEYQPSNKEDNTQITLNQHSNNTQITTTKECKNVYNDKNVINSFSYDPYCSKNKKIFIQHYKDIFNKKVYLGRSELIRLSEIAKDNNLEDVLPIALNRLKNIEFKDIDFKPSANWLLRGNNFERVMNGEFGSKEEAKQQAIQQEQDKQKEGLEKLRALNPELAEQLERTMNEV